MDKAIHASSCLVCSCIRYGSTECVYLTLKICRLNVLKPLFVTRACCFSQHRGASLLCCLCRIRQELASIPETQQETSSEVELERVALPLQMCLEFATCGSDHRTSVVSDSNRRHSAQWPARRVSAT